MKDWKYERAADHGLTPRKQLESVKREVGLVGFLTQCGWRLVTHGYLSIYHRLKVIGRENLPEKAPFILVCNHSSHLDVLALAAALPWRLRQSVFPIAAGDTFFETPSAAFAAAMLLNALPLWRRRCGSQNLKELRDRLVSGPGIFILFPEGTRTRDGEMRPFKPGIGMLIADSGVPVVPCHLSGSFAALPPKGRFPRPRKLELRIERALTFEDATNDRHGWTSIASQLERAVRSLVPPEK